MKQTTKINILIIVAVIFILVLGLFALARFFGKQIIQPCMQEGFTDSEINAELTKLNNPATKKSIIEKNLTKCDVNIPVYKKPGLVSRIVFRGPPHNRTDSQDLALKSIQLKSPNKIYSIKQDFELQEIIYTPARNGSKAKHIVYRSRSPICHIIMKQLSEINSIMIQNRFQCCWEDVHHWTMYGYDSADSELFSKKLDDHVLSNYRSTSTNDMVYEANRSKNTAYYLMSSFGYVTMFADNVCVYKVPIMDVKIADYKRIYLAEVELDIRFKNKIWMLSDTGEVAMYYGKVSDFTEDRWKNARKIPIPVGYSVRPTIFTSAVLPAIPTTPAPTTPAPTTTRPAPTIAATPAATTPAATTPAATTPAPTTTRPAPTTTRPAPTITATPAATTTRPQVTSVATTSAATITRPPVIPAATTPAATTPSTFDTITVSQLDNAKTIGANSSNYSSAYGAITYNI